MVWCGARANARGGGAGADRRDAVDPRGGEVLAAALGAEGVVVEEVVQERVVSDVPVRVRVFMRVSECACMCGNACVAWRGVRVRD